MFFSLRTMKGSSIGGELVALSMKLWIFGCSLDDISCIYIM